MRIKKWNTIGCAKRDILMYTLHLVLSYVILLALCIALFLFPSQLAIREFEKQDKINQSAEISQYIYNADSVLGTVRNVGTNLLSEDAILNLAYLQNDTQNNSYYSIIKNLKQINSLHGDQFNQVYLYFHNQDALLGVTGKLDLSIYFEKTLSLQILEEQFDLLLQKQIQSGMVLYPTDQYLFTVQTLPINYPDGQYINLIFSIPLQSLFKIQGKEVGVPSIFGIRFQDNTVTIGGVQQDEKDLENIRTALDSSVSKTTISSQTVGNNLLYFAKSQETPLEYFFVISSNRYNEALRNYIFYLEASLIFFFLLAGLIILFSVRHQFQPIQKTFAAINSSCIDDLTYRECQTVDEYVLHLRNERDTYHDFIAKQHQSLKALFISQLINGEILELEQYQKNLQMFNIQFCSSHFCVVIIDMTDKPVFSESNASIELSDSFSFVIRNVVTDLLSEYFCIETFGSEQQVCCILNIKNCSLRESEYQALLQSKFLFALDFLKEKANIYCKFSIGNFHEGFLNIEKSYLEAMSCIEQRYHAMVPHIVFYNQLSDLATFSQTAFPSIYTVEKNHLFLSLLKNGDWNGASKLIRKLLEQLRLLPKYHPLALQSLCHNFLCAFTKVFEGLDTVDGDLIKQITDLFSTDFCMYPIEHIYTTFSDLCEKICTSVQENQEISLLEMCSNVNQYIQEHYTDENLSVSKIARNFSINANYLSSLYRKQEGYGLHKAISRIRIKKACELLSLPSAMTIDEIAQKVGFNNVRTFYRVFTGEMSISPGKYRSNQSE